MGVVFRQEDDRIELPPGFRFHPTDEELITHYLEMKVLDSDFTSIAIGDVDMNKIEPWELPWRAKIGEKDWYFFGVRDKKYPTGLRTNRATPTGYWKATGKDKEIFRGKTLVGMKKTLVFYKGRAPKGEKTNWVSHEYRLEGEISAQNLPKSAKNDWVISRVFHKTNGGKKVHISGLTRSPLLPPLMDPSTSHHVHCFSSNFVASPPQFQGDYLTNNNLMDSFRWNQLSSSPIQGLLQIPGSVSLPDPSAVLRSFVGGYDQGFPAAAAAAAGRQVTDGSREGNTVASGDNSSGVVSNLDLGKKHFEEQGINSLDMDSIWNYCK